MILLAEISDKIWLPMDALITGCGVAVVACVTGLLLRHFDKRLLFAPFMLLLALFSPALIQPVDRDLVALAESEVWQYHTRIRVGFLIPLAIGLGISLFVAKRIPLNAMGNCRGCGYNLASTAGPCPECGTARPASP